MSKEYPTEFRAVAAMLRMGVTVSAATEIAEVVGVKGRRRLIAAMRQARAKGKRG